MVVIYNTTECRTLTYIKQDIIEWACFEAQNKDVPSHGAELPAFKLICVILPNFFP